MQHQKETHQSHACNPTRQLGKPQPAHAPHKPMVQNPTYKYISAT